MTKTRLIADSANSDSIDGSRLKDETVDAAKIEDLSITNAQVSPSASVDSGKIAFTQGVAGAVQRSVEDKLRGAPNMRVVG